MKTKLCDVNPAAVEKLPPKGEDKPGVGVHYVDAFFKAMNAKMPELKRAFENAGFTNVKTVLASGNVVFDARAASDLALCHNLLRKPFSDKEFHALVIRQRAGVQL